VICTGGMNPDDFKMLDGKNVGMTLTVAAICIVVGSYLSKLHFETLHVQPLVNESISPLHSLPVEYFSPIEVETDKIANPFDKHKTLTFKIFGELEQNKGQFAIIEQQNLFTIYTEQGQISLSMLQAEEFANQLIQILYQKPLEKTIAQGNLIFSFALIDGVYNVEVRQISTVKG
jgi:hypothetical protein